MRAASVVTVLLLGCGEGSSPELPPDAEVPPDAAEPAVDAGPAPEITEIRDTVACVGGVVNVYGRHLLGGTGKINGVDALFGGYVTDPEVLILRIAEETPPGTGPIVVTTAGGTANSPSFTVKDDHVPVVTSTTPTAASASGGTLVQVTGTDLDASIVSLRAIAPPQGGTPVTVGSQTDTDLAFTMPNVVPGEYWIQLTELGCGSGFGMITAF